MDYVKAKHIITKGPGDSCAETEALLFHWFFDRAHVLFYGNHDVELAGPGIF
jgi:hypothetical protein